MLMPLLWRPPDCFLLVSICGHLADLNESPQVNMPTLKAVKGSSSLLFHHMTPYEMSDNSVEHLDAVNSPSEIPLLTSFDMKYYSQKVYKIQSACLLD